MTHSIAAHPTHDDYQPTGDPRALEFLPKDPVVLRLHRASAERLGIPAQISARLLDVTPDALYLEGTGLVAVDRDPRCCLRCRALLRDPVTRAIGACRGCTLAWRVIYPRVATPESVASAHAAVLRAAQGRVACWVPRSAFASPPNGLVLDPYGKGTPPPVLVPGTPAVVRDTQTRLVLRAPMPATPVLSSLLGGTFERKERVWEFPRSAIASHLLLERLDGGDLSLPDAMARAAQRVARAQLLKTCAPGSLPAMPPAPTTAWLHQQRAYHFLKTMERAGLFMEMGSGKTRVIIDWIGSEGFLITLVICPLKAVRNVWPGQFALHGAKDRDVTIIALDEHLTIPQRATLAHEAIAAAQRTRKPLVLLVNYDAVWREPLASVLASDPPTAFILDEAHRGKGLFTLGIGEPLPWSKAGSGREEGTEGESEPAPGARKKRGKGLSAPRAATYCAFLGDRVRYKALLTGTPMPNNPLEIFSPMRILDPGVFGTNPTQFQRRYGVFGGYEGREVLAYQNLLELHALVDLASYRVRTQDVLDLPPLQNVTLHCYLSREASTIYRRLERYMAVEIGAGRIKVSNGLVKLLRLQQVTGGFLPELDKETGAPTGTMVGVDPSKSDLLRDQLEDLPRDEPVVVFGRFKEDLVQIRKAAAKLGRPSCEISGDADDLERWRGVADGGAVLAVQIQAGGEAIDLTRARYCFYYTPDWSGGRMQQSRFRVHRPGQTRATYIYRLVAFLDDGTPTVDTDTYAGLDADQDIVALVLDRIAHRYS